MRAGWAEPGQIDCLATLKLLANQCDPPVGELGTKLMKSRGTQQSRGEPSRGVKAGGAEAGVLGANSFGHLQRWSKRRRVGCTRNINHTWRPSTTPVPRDRIF